MRSEALRVPRIEGERWRRRLRELGRLRPGLRIDRDGEWIFLPVTETVGPAPVGQWVEHDFEPRAAESPGGYRERLSDSVLAAGAPPRSFDVIGEIVILRLPATLKERAPEVGRALLDFVPGARAVAVDRGVRGPLRLRDLQIIAGEGPLRTVHRENGLEFAVDLERAYFSPRLAREHDRVARAARPGERVLDLCCGVGPFALTLASRTPSLRVTAVDLNPEAIVLLRENLHRLQLEGRIEAECAEAEEHLRRSGPYDRAILNLPHAGAPLLGPLVDRIVPGGYVHYYEIVERAEASTRRKGLVQGLPPRGTWQLAEEHIVHEYSPSADLRGYTLSRSPASGD